MRVLIPLIGLALLLAGCGNKGPLYLPEPKPGAQKPETRKPATPPPPLDKSQPGLM